MIGSVPRAGTSRPGLWRRLRRTDLVPALLFASPWIIGFLLFQIYPIVSSIYYSFTAYNIMQPPVVVGLANFQQLFTQDDLFKKALANTAIFSVFSVPLDLVVALFFAFLLNRKIPLRPLFRAIFYFPAIVPAVATAILWAMLFNTQGGLVNLPLQVLGLQPIPWLSSPDWAMPALILLSAWGVGPTVVIFLAGLQDVPRVLYEAAEIDGAGALSLVRHVTIPMISPVILFNLIIGLIGALQTFTLPFVLFQSANNQSGSIGGPLNSALFYSVQLFSVAFQQLAMGYAAAMAWILFVIIFVLSLLSMKLSGRFVHYD
jgi:multiple sugar transport system permease protein